MTHNLSSLLPFLIPGVICHLSNSLIFDQLTLSFFSFQAVAGPTSLVVCGRGTADSSCPLHRKDWYAREGVSRHLKREAKLVLSVRGIWILIDMLQILLSYKLAVLCIGVSRESHAMSDCDLCLMSSCRCLIISVSFRLNSEEGAHFHSSMNQWSVVEECYVSYPIWRVYLFMIDSLVLLLFCSVRWIVYAFQMYICELCLYCLGTP